MGGLKTSQELSQVKEAPKSYTFLAAAEKVLDTFGQHKPMHYAEITDIALKQGWLKTNGQTPAATMNAQLTNAIKKAQQQGSTSQFVRAGRGFYTLSKWQPSSLGQQIDSHNKAVRQALKSLLMNLDPQAFEDLIGQLLAEMGFESIEVSRYRKDGGIDVRGVLLIGEVVRIKMAVQVKRWKINVQSQVVQQVRGSLGAHEQGLIITTSSFSKGAIQEAAQKDKSPVALMDGDSLVDLLMIYNLGVKRVRYDLFELDWPYTEDERAES